MDASKVLHEELISHLVLLSMMSIKETFVVALHSSKHTDPGARVFTSCSEDKPTKHKTLSFDRAAAHVERMLEFTTDVKKLNATIVYSCRRGNEAGTSCQY